MTDPVVTPPASQDPTPKVDGTPTGSPTPTPDPDPTDWKAEARKWENRAKANNDAAARLQALEDAQKTEAQKQADALAAAQAKLKAFEHREQVQTWADQVARGSHVPASVLRGDTLEELQAHFEQLKALVPAPGGLAGAKQGVPGVGLEPNHKGNLPLSEQITIAEKAGDVTLVKTLKAMMLSRQQI